MSKKVVKENKVKKLLIMGLDKSGKSSVFLSLKGIRNLMSFYSLNPTRGIKREKISVFGSDFHVWDLGGQEQFRKEYLANFNNNIIGTNKIIFVIDIQDEERYYLALKYLLGIVDKLQELNYIIDFSIFFHKYDPDIEMVNKKFDPMKANAFIEEIKNNMPKNFKYKLAKTSIYTIFQKTNIH
ncbi:MAG: ADP-ribosylation factor-like protein [Candidatus Lokiarchaeota archaeon]